MKCVVKLNREGTCPFWVSKISGGSFTTWIPTWIQPSRNRHTIFCEPWRWWCDIPKLPCTRQENGIPQLAQQLYNATFLSHLWKSLRLSENPRIHGVILFVCMYYIPAKNPGISCPVYFHLTYLWSMRPAVASTMKQNSLNGSQFSRSFIFMSNLGLIIAYVSDLTVRVTIFPGLWSAMISNFPHTYARHQGRNQMMTLKHDLRFWHLPLFWELLMLLRVSAGTLTCIIMAAQKDCRKRVIHLCILVFGIAQGAGNK